MIVNAVARKTITLAADGSVEIIDQNRLPFEFVTTRLETVADAARAISTMQVRGAGLIGATAGFGMYLAVREISRAGTSTTGELATKLESALDAASTLLCSTRPTASNLAWAVGRMREAIDRRRDSADVVGVAREAAQAIAESDAEACRAIGVHGLPIIEEIARKKGRRRVDILTHCNAGALAFVDHGSATAPIYAAHDSGIAVHVWVDETRPRNQGARLTVWELAAHGVPHTLIADNTGGHLMQRRLVDLVIVGTDRVAANGDVANKIGTYLKALAAGDNGVPFFVALPTSTFDLDTPDGDSIPIEERDGDEVRFVSGIDTRGTERRIAICPPTTPAANYAFDVTPARLVTGLITELGVCAAERSAIAALMMRNR
jgi:methylthioribose-1-phosphate isomerase